MTNGEAIRSMDDETLAGLIVLLIEKTLTANGGRCTEEDKERARNNYVEWLGKEVETDECT